MLHIIHDAGHNNQHENDQNSAQYEFFFFIGHYTLNQAKRLGIARNTEQPEDAEQPQDSDNSQVGNEQREVEWENS